MDFLHTLSRWFDVYAFGYPFVMTWYWITGGLLHRWIRGGQNYRPDQPPALSQTPGVSILTPCHNEARYVEETVRMLEQTVYPDFEIVAVNDGSTDRTGEI